MRDARKAWTATLGLLAAQAPESAGVPIDSLLGAASSDVSGGSAGRLGWQR
jgi:hypothetical protein